jgi:hypothetical protein
MHAQSVFRTAAFALVLLAPAVASAQPEREGFTLLVISSPWKLVSAGASGTVKETVIQVSG